MNDTDRSRMPFEFKDPMINQSNDNLLEQITFENIIVNVKRENSQWAVDDISI